MGSSPFIRENIYKQVITRNRPANQATERYFESQGAPHGTPYGKALRIVAEKQQEARMQTLAQTDEMTGLLNKAATQRRIEDLSAEKPGGLYALFIFGIDDFKQANDHFGHVFGDGVIREFARILRGHFRREDLLEWIVSDKFAAFVPAPSEEWAEKKAAEPAALRPTIQGQNRVLKSARIEDSVYQDPCQSDERWTHLRRSASPSSPPSGISPGTSTSPSTA